MNIKASLLAIACATALVACGDQSSDAVGSSAAPASAESSSDPMPAPDAAAPATVAPTTASNGKPAAVVTDCATQIESNDAMQYNVGSITVPASCTEFKITLKHTGEMPVVAMGHNVVVSRTADMLQVTAAGMGAGLDNDYVKPDDPRVIAHTTMIGGGETTSVSFSVSEIRGDGPYEFFCSFPGHSSLMNGSITVE